MSKQKNALQAVLDRQALKRDEVSVGDDHIERVAAKTGQEPSGYHRPSRTGRKLVAGHFDPKVAKQLKILAAEEDTTIQALLEEALNLLFVKKGKMTLLDLQKRR